MSDRQSHTGGPALRRDYSLAGPGTKKAIEAGFDTAEWRPRCWTRTGRSFIHALVEQRKDVTWELPRDWVPPVEPTGQSSAKELRVATAPASREADLGPTSLLAPGELVPVEVDGSAYVLCHTLDGTFAFMDGLCTHGRALLSDGFLDDCIIECPKHNGRFDVKTGEAVRLPAQKPLRTYPVTERDGRLVVCMRESNAPLGELQVGSSLKGA